MTGAFGSAQGAPKWFERQFLENHPRLRVGGLRGSEVIITLNDHKQVVQLEQQWTFGRKQRQRPWFRCPACDRRCRTLHEIGGTALVCRLCSGYDYRSRHRNRGMPTVNKVRNIVARLPSTILAREQVAAQMEIAKLLRTTISDLERRLKRGKRR